ncbi:MAG: hypothetical protein OER86_14330, partial [Phycisphaerae bacterium]|nr:hypothetical protein [Phycisphaerae bacterium]
MSMGPWFVRNDQRPFLPGFSYEIVQKQVRAGRIDANSVIRGPTTHQFWARALQVPGVAHLLGQCHACEAPVRPDLLRCPRCQAPFLIDDQPDSLGLMYPTPESRRQAEAEIQGQRVAPPPAPAQSPPPAPSPAPPQSVEADQDAREVEIHLAATSAQDPAPTIPIPQSPTAPLPPTSATSPSGTPETPGTDPDATAAPTAPGAAFDLW